MRSRFPLFSSHLELAPLLWNRLVTPEDTVCDMTCGNGHDTLTLAKLNPHLLYSLDIQRVALEKAANLCQGYPISFLLKDHSLFPDELGPHSVKLAVYNLGYLPSGDKTLHTLAPTTLLSVQKMLPIIKPGGAISLTCYPGHTEGAHERSELLTFLQSLPPKEWMVTHTSWVNRNLSPSLIWMAKSS